MHLNKRYSTGPETYSNYINGSRQNYDPSSPSNLGWDYPLDLQHLVHKHWRSFPPPQNYIFGLFTLGYIILMLISFFGNGLVIWIFTTSKNLRTPSNLLIINLAVFDLVMFSNMPHYLLNAAFGYIVGADLGCDVYAMAGGISGMGAAISNAFIAYDRYRTISNPIDGRLTYGQIGLLIVFSWLWTVPFSVFPFFQFWGRYLPEGYLTTCTFDYLTDTDEIRAFVKCLFVWAFCIPLVLICINYAKLFGHVRAHEQMLAEQAKKMNIKSISSNQDIDAISVEIRIAKAALTIFFLFLLSWIPYACVALLSVFGYRDLITPLVSMLPATTCKAVSCLDPWVYAASHPKYRLELERRAPWLGIREKHANANAGGSSADGETRTMSMDT